VHTRPVSLATVGTSLIGVFALVQTLAGRSRFDVTPFTGAVLACGIALFVVPAVVVAVASVTRIFAPSR
jgi:hypothetical protein